jgi:EAL domain-containing protein (putative c-di-GMP-specific phosphodiesterase class I)/phosphoribosylcarboxyaminoimidazole (NCAIR) mutase
LLLKLYAQVAVKTFMADEEVSSLGLVRAATGPAAVERACVLLADDEPTILRSLQRVLEAAGYDVLVASDGRAAAALAAKIDFDVVITDIQMPNATGIDLLRSVRSHNLDVPVVLMTGDPRVETAVHALELGAQQYLLKPVDIEAFRQTVDRAVLVHRMAKAKREAMKLLGNLQAQEGDRVGLAASFERAMAGLWMAFQPIADAENKTIFGYEALMRRVEPTLPNPLAVLRRCTAEAFAVAPEGPLLFINLHPIDLNDEDLYSETAPLTKLAYRTVLEITERAALDEISDVRGKLVKLRAMGYRIALDDLGAGYAGLTSFALLEPEFVKLDMSLVRDVHESSVKQKLIRSMTSVCKELDIRVVAEGIEVSAERDMVIPLGCGLLQGYLLGRPGPPFPGVIF